MRRNFAKTISLMLVLSIFISIPAWAETVEPTPTATTDTTMLDIEQHQFMRGTEGLTSFKDKDQFLLPIDTTRESQTSFTIGTNEETVSLYENAVDNIVVVENVEHTDDSENVTSVSCYFRTIFAVECPEGLSDGVEVMLSGNKTAYTWTSVNGYATINNVRFKLYVAEYKSELKPGNIAPASLYQLYLPATASSADAALFGEGLDVMVITQCIQSGDFSDLADAMKQLGEISATNHPFKETSWLIQLLQKVFTKN